MSRRKESEAWEDIGYTNPDLLRQIEKSLGISLKVACESGYYSCKCGWLSLDRRDCARCARSYTDLDFHPAIFPNDTTNSLG